MERVGRILLRVLRDDDTTAHQPPQLFFASDALALAGDTATQALQSAVTQISAAIRPIKRVTVSAKGLSEWPQLFRVLQGVEIWAYHGAWIREVQPTFGPSIRERFEWPATIYQADVAAAKQKREQVAARLDALLGQDAVLCLPSAPGIAPPRDTPAAELETFRTRALSLLCIAGRARLPQMSLPLGMLDDCPLGLSLIAPHGADMLLLKIAASLSHS